MPLGGGAVPILEVGTIVDALRQHFHSGIVASAFGQHP